MIDWRCIRRKIEESIDHFSLHCKVVRALWNDFFSRVGITSIMLRRMVDLFANWRGLYGSSQIVAVWKMTPYLSGVIYLKGNEW